MKKIRLKFFAIAAASLFVVLFSIIAGLNISNYFRLVETSKTDIQLIIDNPLPTNEEPVPPEPTPEVKYKFIYFVSTYVNDELMYIDMSHSIKIEENVAIQYSNEIYKSNAVDGFKEGYFYKRVDENISSSIYFLDRTQELAFFQDTLKNSAIISSVGYLVVLVLIYFFSFLIIRPAEEANKKQKRFITDASHELKTPLTIINSNISVIELENGKTEWTDSIHKQVNRLTKMTNDLVLLSKLNEDKIKINMVDIEFEPMIDEIINAYESVLKNKNINLNTDIPSGITIKGDALYLSQMFYTLMDNMAKYAYEGNAYINAKRVRNLVEIDFSNNIDPNSEIDSNLIFDRFYKADKSRSANKNSFGIGLSMAKAIVELHKGKISAVIADNKLTIKIIFPIK